MNDKLNSATLNQGKSRAYFGRLAALVSITLNLTLFIIKAILGFFTGSLALIADAFHSLSDLATSFVVLVSFHFIAKPSDEKHPFGHGRAEFISAIIMSTLLAITSFELFKHSITRIMNPTMIKVTWWVTAIIFLTVIVKEGLAVYSFRISKKIQSDTVKADAWHHHLDAISSLLVVISFILADFGYPYLDGPIGVLITITILYSAYKIAKSPIDHLLGTPPNEKLLDKIEKITLSFPEVKGVHDVIIHNYGEMMVISLDIEIDENLPFIEAHNIAELIDKELRTELNSYVTIHFDPVMERTPVYQKIENVIRQFCIDNIGCDSFHDLRIYGKGDNLTLIFDLVGAHDPKVLSDQKLIDKCKGYIYKHIPEVKKVSIKMEPMFSISRKSRHN